MPARNRSALCRNKVDISGELLTMSRDFAIRYKDNVVHARNISAQYRAVIDHSKDIVAMSGTKCILTLFKTNNYIALLIMSLYIVVKYTVGGAMYMYKMEDSGRNLPSVSSLFTIAPVIFPAKTALATDRII